MNGGVREARTDLDARVLGWLTAPEGASSRRVLDDTFADLAAIPQERWRPWTPLVDGLSRPWSIELPRWAWIVVALLLLVTIALASLTAAGRLRPFFDRLSALPADPAAMVEVACPDAFAAAGDVTCRMASVAERHERAGGGPVRLLVAEFSPTPGDAVADAEPVLQPISLDPAGQRTVADLGAMARSTGRTVIGVQPRGTGASEPSLACPEVASLGQPADGAVTDPAWRTSLADAVRSCRDRLVAQGVDVDAYGLSEQAADLESIRKGLGIDRWLVRAIGDDSRLALELIRSYPDGVATAVLVGPSFPGVAPDPDADALGESIEGLASLCAVDEFCAGRYVPPDQAWAAVDALPPAAATVAARAMRSALATPVSVGGLPSRLERLAAGDLAWPDSQLAEQGWCLGYELSCASDPGWFGGGELATRCLGRAPSAGSVAASGGLAPGTAAVFASDPWDVICGAWTGEARDPSTIGPVTSDVPVIVFASRIDPFHSTRATGTGMRGLRAGVLIPLPWAPEGTGVDCLDARDAAWIDDASVGLPAACTAVELPRFADVP